MGQDLVPIVKLDPEHGVRQRLDYRPLDLDGILLRQAPGFPLEHAEIRRPAADANPVYGAISRNVYLSPPQEVRGSIATDRDLAEDLGQILTPDRPPGGRQVEALAVSGAESSQRVEFPPGLDPLGDDGCAQIGREGDHGGGQGTTVSIPIDA